MFNINTLEAIKQGVRENMEANLIWDKYHGTMKHITSKQTESKNVDIMFNDAPVDAAIKHELVSMLYADGTKVDVEELTEQPYCTVRMVGTRYNYETFSLRDEITDRQVSQATKRIVLSTIRLATGRKYVQVDCKVMDLFKDGFINWETVLESHGKDCSL